MVPPHQLVEYLEYEGYRFPAGVGFVFNNVATHQDFTQGYEFMPERWLDGNNMNALSPVCCTRG